MKIKIEKIGINGEGIGYVENKPTFIPSALPSETVEAIIDKKFDRYNVGHVEQILIRSPKRMNPPCPVQDRCGGCALMTCTLPYQAEIKEELLKEALTKYAGNIDFRLIKPIVVNPVPYSYRNQCKLPVRMSRGQLISGMYQPSSNHFVAVDRCLVHEEELDNKRTQILAVLQKHGWDEFNPKTYKGLRYIILRGFDGIYQVTLVTGKNRFTQECIDDLCEVPGLNSIYASINLDKHTHELFGNEVTHLALAKTLECKMGELVFRLSPQSFFQLNRTQALNIYSKVEELVKPSKLIVEAYCGVGAMTLMLSKKGEEVIGIETISSAVKNANENARLNKIKNVQFIAGDAAVQLQNISKKQPIDVLVVDPPRSGLDDTMIAMIMKSRIPHLIYVSCNPSTLAKNLKYLLTEYDVEEITPFELFSHTPLVETVVSLRRLNKKQRTAAYESEKSIYQTDSSEY